VCHAPLCQFTSLLNIFIIFSLLKSTHTHLYTLSLHDALPILRITIPSLFWKPVCDIKGISLTITGKVGAPADTQLFISLLLNLRSEEHTSELQSRFDLVCRLLLEKKKNN